MFNLKTEKLLIYLRTRNMVSVVIPTLIFFLVFLLGWIKDAGSYASGLYSEVDGQLFAWYAKALVEWSIPTDLQVLNPFQGMGTLFLPYNSWWNPGALALSLPLNNLPKYIISYSIYWFEAFFSIFFLARAIGLRRLEALFASQMYVLLLFPPFIKVSGVMPLLTLAPFFAHLNAIANLMAALYIKLGFGRWFRNFAIVCFLLLGCLIFISSGAFFVITFIPAYAVCCFGLTLRDWSLKSIAWKAIALAVIGGVLLFLELPSYLSVMSDYTTRGIGFGSTFISFSKPVWKNTYDICTITPSVGGLNILGCFCKRHGFSHFIYLFAFLGGLIGLLGRSKKYSWLAFSFCLIALIPDIWSFLMVKSILKGKITAVNPFYLSWATNSFFCIFFVIFIVSVWNFLAKIITLKKPVLDYFSNFFIKNINLNSFNNLALIVKNKSLILAMVIPIISSFLLISILHKKTPLKKSKVPVSIEYLRKEISLTPNGRFRGSAASYFASNSSPLREIINPKDNNGAFKYQYYIDAWELLKKYHGNMHMLSGLWQYNIPTIEEYAQMISTPMYVFFKNLLSDPKNDVFTSTQLNVYKLDIRILRALGVRFIITDKQLNKSGVTLVLEQRPINSNNLIDFKVSKKAMQIFEELINKTKIDLGMKRNVFLKIFKQRLEQTFNDTKFYYDINKVMSGFYNAEFMVSKGVNKEKLLGSDLDNIKKFFSGYLMEHLSFPIYLYEINSTNLGTFSPTIPKRIHSVRDMLLLMGNQSFSFEKTIIIQEDIATNLVPAKNAVMSFDHNAVRIHAESDKQSLLLLPLQYSNCFHVSSFVLPNRLLKDISLMRANLIQSAILFKGDIDVVLRLNGGLDAECRKKDVADLKKMGIDEFLLESSIYRTAQNPDR